MPTIRPRAVIRARTRSTAREQRLQRLDGQRLRRDRHDQPVGGDHRVDVEQRKTRAGNRAGSDRSAAPRDRASAAASLPVRAPRTARRRRWRARSIRSADRDSASSVWRTAFRMGYFSSRQAAADGFNWCRGTPSQREAEAWLSRSTSRIRRLGEASAAARFTAAVVLPTPPLLLRTAMTTGNLSGILSTNRDRAAAGNLRGPSAGLQCGRQRSSGGRPG